MAKKIKLFDIEDVQFAIHDGDKPQLAISVTGRATSSGWTDAELIPLEKKLSPDGILDISFVATPPDGISMPVLTRMTASTVWTTDVEKIIGVNFHVRTGEVLEMLIDMETGVDVPFPLNPDAARFTTLAVGEEGRPPTTLRFGEEGGRPTTLRFGEEGPTPSTPRFGEEGPLPTTKRLGEEGPRPTTLVFGEEGPQPTTRRLGEEAPNPTTLRLGEEGPRPTTLVVGEEGPQPTTMVAGEEDPQTGFQGEGDPKPFFGETDPRTEGGGFPGEDLDWFEPDDFNPFGNR